MFYSIDLEEIYGEWGGKKFKNILKIFVNIDVWPFVHRKVELRVRQNVANSVGEE